MIRLHQARRRSRHQNMFMNTQSASLPVVEKVTRLQAIDRIRLVLSALEDERSCACAVAARFGVFCQGFRALSDREFRQRFYWIARPRPQASRQELEELVSAYHLGRQQVAGASLCCDVETRDHCACDGWNRFDNAALEAFCYQVTGKKIRID